MSLSWPSVTDQSPVNSISRHAPTPMCVDDSLSRVSDKTRGNSQRGSKNEALKHGSPATLHHYHKVAIWQRRFNESKTLYKHNRFLVAFWLSDSDETGYKFLPQLKFLGVTTKLSVINSTAPQHQTRQVWGTGHNIYCCSHTGVWT